MMNKPFPYLVSISRMSQSPNPFKDEGSSSTLIYEGYCDYEVNRFPTLKSGVQTERYKMYIKDNTIPVMKGDLISLELSNRNIEGVISDYIPTNFGLTIFWDVVDN